MHWWRISETIVSESNYYTANDDLSDSSDSDNKKSIQKFVLMEANCPESNRNSSKHVTYSKQEEEPLPKSSIPSNKSKGILKNSVTRPEDVPHSPYKTGFTKTPIDSIKYYKQKSVTWHDDRTDA